MTPFDKLYRQLNVLAETDAQAALLVHIARKVFKVFKDGGTDVEGVRVICGSILSTRTKAGMVELLVGQELVQMDLAKAREVRDMLVGADERHADAAIKRFVTANSSQIFRSSVAFYRTMSDRLLSCCECDGRGCTICIAADALREAAEEIANG